MTDLSALAGMEEFGPEMPEMGVVEAPDFTEDLPPVDELDNIAEALDEDTLRTIGEQCVQDYESDEEDRAEWLEMHAKWMRLYYQQDKPVNKQAEWMSEDSLPLMAEACNQFGARAFKAFFPSRKVVKAIPDGNARRFDRERADRVSKHMGWQLMTKTRGYKRDKRRLLLSTAVHGSCFTKTFYDPVQESNVVVNVRAEDLVVPYGAGPRDIEDVERKTHTLFNSLGWAQRLVASGFFIETPEICDTLPQRGTRDASEMAEGIEQTQLSDDDKSRQVFVLEQHCWLEDIEPGQDAARPYIVWVDYETKKVLRITRRYETEDGRIVPVEHFTHYPFLENPDGFYGLGFGHIIGSLNSSSNSLLRQIKDAGTLANIGNHSGFISSSVGPQGGDMRLELGKFGKLPGVERMNDAIWTAKFPGPNQALGEILTLIMSRSDRAASSTDVISGQTDKIMQPTAVLALIEQSLEQFSAVYEGLFDAWGSELQKWYRLNSLYLDFEEYFTVLDAQDNPEEMMVSRGDYARDMQIVPMADPKMSTEQQRLTRAQMEQQSTVQFYMMIAQLLGPQAVPVEALFNAQRRFYEATQVDNMEEILLPPVLPPPPEPPRVDDPKIENMAALRPPGEDGAPPIPPVHVEQNHLEHLAAHEAVINDEAWGNYFPPGGKEGLEKHMQQHRAYLYGMVEANLGEYLEGDGGGQGTGGEMVGQPGDGMVPPGASGPMA